MNYWRKYKRYHIATIVSWVIATTLALINIHFVETESIAFLITMHAGVAYGLALIGLIIPLIDSIDL